MANGETFHAEGTPTEWDDTSKEWPELRDRGEGLQASSKEVDRERQVWMNKINAALASLRRDEEIARRKIREQSRPEKMN